MNAQDTTTRIPDVYFRHFLTHILRDVLGLRFAHSGSVTTILYTSNIDEYHNRLVYYYLNVKKTTLFLIMQSNDPWKFWKSIEAMA